MFAKRPWHRRRPRQQAVAQRPSSDLWDLVVDRDWSRAMQHVQSCPIDAQYWDGHYRESVLYLTMQSSPPVDVVMAILQACPEAVVESCTKNHDYPLHVACSYGLGPDILTAVVRTNPLSSVLQTRWGKTPLDALWEQHEKTKDRRRRQRPEQERPDPEDGIEGAGEELEPADNDDHDHDVDMNRNRELDERNRPNDHAQAASVMDHNGDNIDGDDTVFWEKVTIILQAVARYRSLQADDKKKNTKKQLQQLEKAEAERSHHMIVPTHCDTASDPDKPISDRNHHRAHHQHQLLIHAAVSLGSMGCPYQILEWVVAKYPVQLQIKDHDGFLPLHITIGPSQWTHNQSHRQQPHAKRGSGNIGIGGQRKYRPREGDAIAALLKLHPNAARCKVAVRRRTNDKNDVVDASTKRTSSCMGTAKDRTRGMFSVFRQLFYQKTSTDTNEENGENFEVDSSVSRSSYECYPLHFALLNRHRWSGGVRELFQAYPDALRIRDPDTKLYPFQLAAMLPSVSTSPTSHHTTSTSSMMDPESSVDLETIYQLLRMGPNILDPGMMMTSSSSSSCVVRMTVSDTATANDTPSSPSSSTTTDQCYNGRPTNVVGSVSQRPTDGTIRTAPISTVSSAFSSTVASIVKAKGDMMLVGCITVVVVGFVVRVSTCQIS